MYLPSGEYSGPSSRPGVVVSLISLPPAAGILYTSKSPLRCPVNSSQRPSGDQPCRYDGPFAVMRFGVPPLVGTVYTIETPLSSGELLLMASIRPSNDSTWSLLLRVAKA